MSSPRSSLFVRGAFGALLLASASTLLLLAAAVPARADGPKTLQALLDRAQIEDMLVTYYKNLGGADQGFGKYYTEDGVLDVNGIVATGDKEVEDLYKRIAEGGPRPSGKFNMLLTNPLIVVDGDTATADMIWTGIESDTPQSRPHFVEQGREHDELVKQGGRWYFKHRIITSDAGLTKMFEKTYKKR
ncbi:MAG: nuclear transport factor 2 family protein [Steroidobacteraceae bacterium]